MKLLITGATGFIGSHLCRLATEQHQLRVLIRPSSDLSEIEDLNLERVTGDIADRSSLRSALEGQDAVIHTAGRAGAGTTDQELQEGNVIGTRELASACRLAGVARMVHVSSVSPIRLSGSILHAADERCDFEPDDQLTSYARSKRQAEELILQEVSRGLNAVVVCPAFVFGPHRRTYRGAEFLDSVRRRMVVPCFRGGICVVHVEDVARGILAAMERGIPGERYILGGENLTFKQIAFQLSRLMETHRVILPVPPAASKLLVLASGLRARLRSGKPSFGSAEHRWLNRYHFYDSQKARRSLGFSPRPFEAIVREWLGFSAK